MAENVKKNPPNGTAKFIKSVGEVEGLSSSGDQIEIITEPSSESNNFPKKNADKYINYNIGQQSNGNNIVYAKGVSANDLIDNTIYEVYFDGTTITITNTVAS
jgi:hypothetical protein